MIAEIITRLKFWWSPTPASYYQDTDQLALLIHVDSYNPFTDEVTVLVIAVRSVSDYISDRFVVFRDEWMDRDNMINTWDVM